MPLIARIMEARSSVANPEAWLLRAFNAHATTAGLDVNQDTALESSAVLDGIRMISQDVARVPLHVYRRLEPRGKELVRGHPVSAVLADPNPEIIPMQLREMMTSFAVSAGAGYAQIIFNGGGDPVELWPFPPHRVTPMRTPSGKLVWKITLTDGGERYVPMEEMLVVPGFTRDGILGVDVLNKMREAIGLNLATERFGSSFFGNGSNPGGYIKVPAMLSDKAYARLVESWEKKHRGIENAHRVALLEEGAEWGQMGVPPEAAQFLETRKFQVTEVARALNLPPHKLKDLERATFSNIEEQSIDYIRGSLGPWYVRWEQAVMKRLFTPRDRTDLFIEHIIAGLLRGDLKTRYDAYSVGRQNSWLSPNDVRDMENLNPIEGGDDYHVQVNMMRLQDAGMLAPEPDTPPEPDPEADRALSRGQERSLQGRNRQRQAYERLFLSAAGRAVRREVGGIRKALRSGSGAFDTAGFLAAVDVFYEGHEAYMRDIFSPLFRSFSEVIAGEVEGEVGRKPDVPAETVDEYAEQFSARNARKGAAKLKKVVRETEAEAVEDALDGLLDKWGEEKAEDVARREGNRAANAFAYFAYQGAGVLALRVVASGACPYCAPLNGRTVGMDRPVVEEGEPLTAEGQAPMVMSRAYKHPPFHDGCDCQIVASSF